MEKEFVPYEQALALKELGFDEKCLSCYLYEVKTFSWELNYQISNNSIPWIISAPLYQQAFRWFREKHRLYHSITREIGINTSDIFFVASFYKGKKGNSPKNTCISSKTYEEAELECLKKLIEIVKEQK